MSESWLNKVNWAQDGLVPAVAQEAASGRVLTLAWMNREALKRTVETGEAHYWSRSRKKLWHKGEESGHWQDVRSIHVDCDGDTILLKVFQHGGAACHTGFRSCFYRQVTEHGIEIAGERVFDPEQVYKKT